MLILIGTMPAAYALNHTISPAETQSFIVVLSSRPAQILDRHIGQALPQSRILARK